jgi:Holliday junction resolvase RusA-like endonuclease
MLDIQDDRARGLDEVRINGRVYCRKPSIIWSQWYVRPNTKVRSMRSDAWKKRPCWVKYCEFKDAIKRMGIEFKSGDHVVFHFSMPLGWSKKKKARMIGQPHEQTPDLDNILGGLWDAIFTSAERGGKGDQHVHTVGSMKKVWSVEDAIEIGRPV